MDWQEAFNYLWGLAVAAFLLMVKNLHEGQKEMRKELEAMRVLVAGNYITRAEHVEANRQQAELLRSARIEQRETDERIFEKLDEIARELRRQ